MPTKMKVLKKKLGTANYGRSPDLVVMGGDSCSRGRGFESLHRRQRGRMAEWFKAPVSKRDALLAFQNIEVVQNRSNK